MIRTRFLPAIPYPVVVLSLCMVATLALALLSQGMGVLYPFIQKDIDANRAQLGLMASGQMAGQAFTVLLAGWMADVIGVRRLWTVSLIGVGIGLLLFSQIQSVSQGILVGVLIGLAFSGSGPANTKAIMDWVTRRARAVAVGINEAMVVIGGIVAAGLLTFLAVSYDWRVAVMVMATIIAVSGILILAFFRDKPGDDVLTDKMSRPRGKVPQVLRNPDIWLATFVGATLAPLQRVLVAYLVLYLMEDLGLSAGEAGGMLAILMAGAAVGRIGWAMASDLILKGRRIGILVMVFILAVVSLSLMALLPSDTSLSLVAVLVFAVGAVTLGRTGVYVVFLAEMAGPALTGTTMGFQAMIATLAGIGITPLFGLLADRTGSYAMSWWMMAAVSGFGILILAIIGSRARESANVVPPQPPK